MSNQVIYIIMGVSVALFALILIAYFILNKKMQKSEYKKIYIKNKKKTRST